MSIMGRISITLAAALCAGWLFVVPRASGQNGTIAGGAGQFTGSVNSAGEIRDASGQVVGRVTMAVPGMPFDINTMTIRPDGTVLDASGQSVGRVMMGNGVGAAAARRRQPQALQMPEQLSPAVRESRGPAGRLAARSSRSVVMGARQNDLANRRQKVAARIQSELAEGRITDGQAAELSQQLESTAREEAKYERRGVVKDRDMLSLYRKWDRIMEKLDADLEHNAHDAAGLRTK